MLPQVPSEGSYATWLAQCLERYFEGLGFTFYSEIQTQPRENDYPFDIYASIQKGNFVKRFGLQVKRPNQLKKDISWDLDQEQHDKIRNYHWIWYALPDFFDRKYYKVACFHTIFKSASFSYKSTLHLSNIGFYLRLGTFANKIEECKIGEKIKTDWVDSITLFKEYPFADQIHAYLDFTEMKAQLFTNINPKERS